MLTRSQLTGIKKNGMFKKMHGKMFSVKCQLWTPWGQVMHICIGKLTIIGLDNGFNAWTVPNHYLNQFWNIVIWIFRNNFFSEILIGIQRFSFKEMHLKMLSAKWCPFCLGPNVLSQPGLLVVTLCFYTGGPLNVKILSYRYRYPHVKDKTVSRPSYL